MVFINDLWCFYTFLVFIMGVYFWPVGLGYSFSFCLGSKSSVEPNQEFISPKLDSRIHIYSFAVDSELINLCFPIISKCSLVEVQRTKQHWTTRSGWVNQYARYINSTLSSSNLITFPYNRASVTLLSMHTPTPADLHTICMHLVSHGLVTRWLACRVNK
jgi:hypothetical protein